MSGVMRIYSDRTMSQSQVPEWIVSEELVEIEKEDGTTERRYDVTCPRRDCGGNFWPRLRWKKPRVTEYGDGSKSMHFTKSCPYCFRVAWLPERLVPKKYRGRTGRLVRGEDYNENGERLDIRGNVIPRSDRKIRSRR